MPTSDAPRLQGPHLSDVELQMMEADQSQRTDHTEADEIWRIARLHDEELHPYEVVFHDPPPSPPTGALWTAPRIVLYVTAGVSLAASLASLGLTVAWYVQNTGRV